MHAPGSINRNLSLLAIITHTSLLPPLPPTHINLKQGWVRVYVCVCVMMG